MVLPSKVREQGEAAEKLAQELLKNSAHADTPDPGPVADPPENKAPQKKEDWKKRFIGLKKSYDTTVSSLREQVRKLEAKIDKLGDPPPAPAPVTDEDIQNVLTEQQKKDYDPKFVTLVGDISRAANANIVNRGVEDRVTQLESTQSKSRDDAFWDAVNKAVPEWRTLQGAEDMQAWLLEYDDLLGMTRDEAMANAQRDLDSAKVIAIFKQYSVPAKADLMDEDEADLIAPDANEGDGGAPPSKDQKIWTVKEIEDFYKNLALKKRYQGPAGKKRADQIEKQIEKARDEGRITE